MLFCILPRNGLIHVAGNVEKTGCGSWQDGLLSIERMGGGRARAELRVSSAGARLYRILLKGTQQSSRKGT